MAPRKRGGGNRMGNFQTATSSSEQNKQTRKTSGPTSNHSNHRASTKRNSQVVLLDDDIDVSSGSKQSKQRKKPAQRNTRAKNKARGTNGSIEECILIDEDSGDSSSSKDLRKQNVLDSPKKNHTKENDLNFFSESSEDELLNSSSGDALQSTCTRNGEDDLRELNQRHQFTETVISDSDCSVTTVELNGQPDNRKNTFSFRVNPQKPVALDSFSRDDDVVPVDVGESASCAPSISSKKRTSKKRGLILTDNEIKELHMIPVLPSARIFNDCIEAYHKETFEDYLKAQGVQDKDDAAREGLVSVDDDAELEKINEKGFSKEAKAKVDKLKKIIQKQRLERERRLENVLASTVSLINAEAEKEEIEVVSVVEEPTNRMFDVRVRYQNQTTKFLMKKDEQFVTVFIQLSTIHKLDVSRIMLCVREVMIYPEDTPEKVKLNDIDVLECLLYAPGDEKNNKNWINVKIQSNDIKQIQVFSLHKLQPFTELMKQYSKQRGIPIEKMVFSFDGEKIDPAHHSLDLTLENNDVVDVKIL